MPFIPTIDTSGIGQAIGAAIQVADRVQQRAEQAKLAQAKMEMMSFETEALRNIKATESDPLKWAGLYRDQVTQKAKSLSESFGFTDTQDMFTGVVGQAAEQKVLQIYEEADKRVHDKTMLSFENSINSSQDIYEATAIARTFATDQSVISWLGDAGARKLADQAVAQKGVIDFKNILATQGPVAAEQYIQLLDSAIGDFSGAYRLAGQSLADLRLQNHDKISSQVLVDESSKLNLQALNVAKNPNAVIEYAGSILKGLNNGTVGKGSEQTAGVGMNEHDKSALGSEAMRLIAMANAVKSEWADRADKQAQVANAFTLDNFKASVDAISNNENADQAKLQAGQVREAINQNIVLTIPQKNQLVADMDKAVLFVANRSGTSFAQKRAEVLSVLKTKYSGNVNLPAIEQAFARMTDNASMWANVNNMRSDEIQAQMEKAAGLAEYEITGNTALTKLPAFQALGSVSNFGSNDALKNTSTILADGSYMMLSLAKPDGGTNKRLLDNAVATIKGVVDVAAKAYGATVDPGNWYAYPIEDEKGNYSIVADVKKTNTSGNLLSISVIPDGNGSFNIRTKWKQSKDQPQQYLNVPYIQLFNKTR